jgi:hypothetical protein
VSETDEAFISSISARLSFIYCCSWAERALTAAIYSSKEMLLGDLGGSAITGFD